jgi:hypothetical protein
MRVRELVEALLKQDQDATVGVTMSSVHGHVVGVRGLCLAEHGGETLVCVDQTEESLADGEEQDLEDA